MKKGLFLVLCLILSIGMLTGCGKSDNNSAGNGDAAEPIVIKIAADETMETPCSKATVIFQDLVAERSEGRLKIEYFPDSAMGDEREIAESVNMGTLEMGIISGAYMAVYAPDWYVTDLPYVFADRSVMYSHLDGALGSHLKEAIMTASKIEVLDFCDGSFKILLNGKKDVKTAQDLVGMKFRCQENKMNMALYKAWNSTAVPMGMSEVYTALQQGTIDGVDTSPLYQESQKFYEVGKHYTMTNHQALLMVSIINQDFMNSLPEDLQQVLRDCSYEAYSVKEREIVIEAEKNSCKVMDDAGCVEYKMTDAEKQTFVDGSKAVYEEYRSIVSAEAFKLLGI